ncbi:hypothetical protein CEXT_88551 [Caerostris extrusa]|uniref:Uncharacterized protein n=1 Tax=Caerostris extrusa TaxID=172846 RepID=A0AAV4WU91_CAEEX|nr:hypothetical protein CEXT_88551 [Caerostris extrusa]
MGAFLSRRILFLSPGGIREQPDPVFPVSFHLNPLSVHIYKLGIQVPSHFNGKREGHLPRRQGWCEGEESTPRERNPCGTPDEQPKCWWCLVPCALLHLTSLSNACEEMGFSRDGVKEKEAYPREENLCGTPDEQQKCGGVWYPGWCKEKEALPREWNLCGTPDEQQKCWWCLVPCALLRLTSLSNACEEMGSSRNGLILVPENPFSLARSNPGATRSRFSRSFHLNPLSLHIYKLGIEVPSHFNGKGGSSAKETVLCQGWCEEMEALPREWNLCDTPDEQPKCWWCLVPCALLHLTSLSNACEEMGSSRYRICRYEICISNWEFF